MATATRSSDILAACLLLCGYRLDAGIAEAIEAAEAYAQENGCYIGTGPDDFRNALFWLTHDIGQSSLEDLMNFPGNMGMRLWELAGPLLRTRELSCNDEGESWVGEYALADVCDDSSANWLDDFEDPVDITYEYEIRRLFAMEGLTDESVAAFIEERRRGVQRILSACFRGN